MQVSPKNILVHVQKYWPISFLLFFGILISKLIGPIFGPMLFFLVLVTILSTFIPSKYFTQKLALASTFLIGLSPIYLIIRGFFTESRLNLWDFQLYGISIILIFSIYLYILKKAKSENFLTYNPKQKFSLLVSSLTGFVFALIIELLLIRKSPGHAVAWIASGDSKNHAANGVNLINFGHLNIETFLVQPSSSPSFLSLVLSQRENSFEVLRSNLEIFMESYAFVWILLIGVLGISFAGLAEIVWDKFSTKQLRIPNYAVILASLLATYSFVLGPALYDGFFTALFGVATVVTLIGWFLEISSYKNFSFSGLLIGFLIFSASVMAWMFVVPFTFAIFLFGVKNILSKKFDSSLKSSLLIFGLTLLIGLIVHYSNFGQDLIYRSKTALNFTGAVNASPPKLFFILVATLFVMGILIKISNNYFGNLLITIAIVQIVSLFGFKFFSNLGWLDWNYYLLKYQWIMFSALFSLVAIIAFSLIFAKNSLNFQSTVVLLILLAFVSFTFSEVSVSSNRTWQKIWVGWENPRSNALNRAFNQPLDAKNPTLFFHHGYGGDAMLTNFWLTAFTDPVEPIKGWNYTIDTTGDVKQLCEVNAYYPEVTVITSDTQLEELIKGACPEEDFKVVLDTPLF